MRLIFPTDVLHLLDLLREVVRPEKRLFLVGGAVRDALLGRASQDLDFVIAENPTDLARKVARRLGAGFFVLDDARHTARVLYRDPSGKLAPIDFVQFTGDSLEADLLHRDFTINAIAVPLNDLSDLIDPLGGQEDLEEGLLKPCSLFALDDDPVRVLRAIRLSRQLGFRYAPELPELMQAAAVQLKRTSVERQRDEFFKILSGVDPAEGMADCRRFGVFDTLLPLLTEQEPIPACEPHVLPLFDHTLSTVENLDWIVRSFSLEGGSRLSNANWWLEDTRSELKDYAAQIKDYFAEEITPGRSKHSLALLSALLHDIGKPQTMHTIQDGRLDFSGHEQVGAVLAWEAAKGLQLSNAEADWVKRVVLHHICLVPLARAKTYPDRRAIYRYFQTAGEAGIAVALLALANKAATYQDRLTEENWRGQMVVTRALLKAWWEQRTEVVSPAPLLNGNDLQREFGLPPGEDIGCLLGALTEEQAAGEVSTKQEGKSFIRDVLKLSDDSEKKDDLSI